MSRLACLMLLAIGCGGGGDGAADAAVPLPDAAPLACDVFRSAEECTANAARPKCSYTVAQGRLTTRCVAQNGTLGAGATCTRGALPGEDDCDKGLFCSGLGLPADTGGTPVMRLCRPYCSADTACGTGQSCVALLLDPAVAICLPTGCALFDTTCPEHTTCDAYVDADARSFVGLCRIDGTVAVGGDCGAADCVPNARCLAESAGVFRCHAHCDDTHFCGIGTTCSTFNGLPNGGGLCR